MPFLLKKGGVEHLSNKNIDLFDMVSTATTVSGKKIKGSRRTFPLCSTTGFSLPVDGVFALRELQ